MLRPDIANAVRAVVAISDEDIPTKKQRADSLPKL